ncbi:MAG: hypothetical protein PUB18_05210 [bacterium]|nr:hypothetical protein [bacterium]
MNRKYFENYAKEHFDLKSQELVLDQIRVFYDCLDNFHLPKHNYKIGDNVLLKKGTFLHGTYRNIDGLRDIINQGLIASWFIDGRISKYPSSVGVWHLKKDYQLLEYINFYSGGTIRYFNQHDEKKETEVIKYDEVKDLMDKVIEKDYLVWHMEQTKEARFLPSLAQNKVQIGIIFNVNNEYAMKLLNGDILNSININDDNVKEFVNESYYDRFIIDRKNKDDFFTDRESAILFGLPSNLIEGILVGRKYEEDKNILEEIKKLLPNAYICNLDGKIIVE